MLCDFPNLGIRGRRDRVSITTPGPCGRLITFRSGKGRSKHCLRRGDVICPRSAWVEVLPEMKREMGPCVQSNGSCHRSCDNLTRGFARPPHSPPPLLDPPQVKTTYQHYHHLCLSKGVENSAQKKTQRPLGRVVEDQLG